MRHARGLWVCCFLLLSAAVLFGVAVLTSDHASAQEQSASNSSTENTTSDEARWRDGELIPPLPKDPTRRAEAIRRARRIAESRKTGRKPDIVVLPEYGMMEGTPVIVDKSKLTTRPSHFTASRAPYLPPVINPDEPFVQTDIESGNNPGELLAVEPGAPASMVSGAMTNFDAIGFTGFTNASPDIDVGPEHLVAVANDMVAVYDKCGNWLEGGTFLDYFGQVSSHTFYDPRVIYDDWRGHWVVVFTEIESGTNDSNLRVAVSNSSDPTEGWGAVYIIDWNAPIYGFADNMYLADDPEAVYITYNRFSTSSYTFSGTSVSVIPKDQLYQFGAVSFTTFTGSVNPGDGSPAFAIRPAQMNSWVGEMYLINNKYQGGSIKTVWKIDGTATSPNLTGYSMSGFTYAPPPPMRQPNGTYIRSLDCRYTDAVYSGGTLYGARSALVEYTAGDKAGVYVDRINPFLFSTASFSMNYPDVHRSFPAIDVDEYANLILTSAACGDAMYPSFIYDILKMYPLTTIESGTIAAGLADYSLGGAGTSGNPYRWGAYSAAALDHADSRTFWTHGAYSSIDPVPSWTTRIGAYAYFANGNLDVSPSSAQTTVGYYEGYFSPNTFTYILDNTGETMVNWTIDGVPTWLTPSSVKGQLPAGTSQDITLMVNSFSSWYEIGTHTADIVFDNCTGGGGGVRRITLVVAEPFDCKGSVTLLWPDVGTWYSGQRAGEHSVFVTALEDIDLCAIEPFISGPDAPVTCRVYEADGTTRGPLMAENTQYPIHSVFGHKFIPVEVTLEACQDYEIAYEIPASTFRGFANEIDVTYPFDVGGIIRVRKGAFNGDAGATWIPFMSLLATSESGEWTGHTTDLLPSGPVGIETTHSTQQGLFITALENMRLCSIGFEADLVRDTQVSAWLYEATGNTQGDLVLYGAANVDVGGMATHKIPLNANLEYGQDYHVTVYFRGDGYWPSVDEIDISLPDTVDGVVEVRKGTSSSSPSTVLPHIRLNWDDYATGGYPFDLAKASDGIPPPFSQIGNNLDHGAYVESMTKTQVYGLGVMADIPEGEILLARIYHDTGLSRGALLAEGLIYTAGSGMRWHDVPMAFEWIGGMGCDISFVCANVNELPYWDDTTGFPFVPYGTIEVHNAEIAGDPSYTPYVHMRVHGCDNVPTGIGDSTPSFSPMTINPPVPNPANGIVRFDYSVDQPAVAKLGIYDVLGRRVAVVFTGEQIPAGPGNAQFDTSTLASGVYFLKLETPKMAVSRKFVVTH